MPRICLDKLLPLYEKRLLLESEKLDLEKPDAESEVKYSLKDLKQAMSVYEYSNKNIQKKNGVHDRIITILNFFLNHSNAYEKKEAHKILGAIQQKADSLEEVLPSKSKVQINQTQLIDYSFQKNATAIDIAPSADEFAVGLRCGSILIYEKDTLKYTELKVSETSIKTLRYSPCGLNLLAGTSNGQLVLISLKSGELLSRIQYSIDVDRLSFSPCGQYILSSHPANHTKLWSVQDGSLLHSFEGSLNVSASVFSHCGKYLIFGAIDGKIHVWSQYENKVLFEINTHEDRITSIAFSPCNKYFATSSYDRSVQIFNLATGQLIRELDQNPFSMITSIKEMCYDLFQVPSKKKKQAHSNWVHSVTFSNCGSYMLTASGDATIRLWCSQTGQLLKTAEGHNGAVVSAQFAACGKEFMTTSVDNTVRIWNFMNE
jgi:WD40 repeat protein